jgi:hypothetical protein
MANALQYQPSGWFGQRYNVTGWDDATRGDAFRYDPSADISGNGAVYTINPEFEQFAAQSGFKPVQWTGPDGQPQWGVLDAQGNLIPESMATGQDDRAFWNAAMLAGAVTGANMGAAGFGANGLEAGAGGGAEAGSGAFMEANAGAAAPVGNSGGLSAYQAAQGAGGASAAGGTGTKTAGGGSMGTSLSDFFSGNGSASDYGRAATGLYQLYQQGRAADAASAGQAESNALMREMWQANRADNQPLLDMRNSVLPKINALMANPSSITQDPGYQFGLQQGQNQIDNSLAAQGGYYSGRQLKASQKFGQDYAGTKFTDSLNRLMGVAGLGQVGSTQNQQNNNNLAGGLGQGLVNAGNIRGSGYLGQANTVGNAVNSWFGDRWMDQYMKKPG